MHTDVCADAVTRTVGANPRGMLHGCTRTLLGGHDGYMLTAGTVGCMVYPGASTWYICPRGICTMYGTQGTPCTQTVPAGEHVPVMATEQCARAARGAQAIRLVP